MNRIDGSILAHQAAEASPAAMGDVEAAGGALFGAGVAAVVAGGGVGVAMAHDFLDGGQILPGVEHVTGEGAAKVVGGEATDTGLGGAVEEDGVDGLGG